MIEVEVITSVHYTVGIEEEQLIALYGHATDEDVRRYIFDHLDLLHGDEEIEAINVEREEDHGHLPDHTCAGPLGNHVQA